MADTSPHHTTRADGGGHPSPPGRGATLIRGGHLVTMDPAVPDRPVGDVLVRDGRIAEVADRISAPGADVIEAAGRIVAPGFVDGHRHSWQSLLRGVSTAHTFPQYMVERARYGVCFDPDAAYLANYLAGLESIAAGVTTHVDHSHLQSTPDVSDALVRGLLDSGAGGFFAYALQNAPAWPADRDLSAEALNDLLTRAPDPWHEENYRRIQERYFTGPAATGRLRLGVATPETTPYLPVEAARAILEQARALGPALITGHWNSSVRDGRYVSTLGRLAEAGCFDGPTLLTHGNQLADADLAVMAEHAIGLCTTPGTEGGMGLGPMRARALTERGGAAALGTDLTSYAGADLLREARHLLLAERRDAAKAEGALPRQLAWSAGAVLELATSAGARALGLGDETGSITPGKRADLVVVAPDPVRAAPAVDPLATLVFYTNPADIETVLVQGVVRKRGGVLTDVDTAALPQQTADALRRVAERRATLPAAYAQAWAGLF